MTDRSVQIDAVVAALLARNEDIVSLDAIAEAIGVLPFGTPEISAIFDALEARGRKLAEDAPFDAQAALKQVLGAARALSPQLGRRPTTAEIASFTGMSDRTVRVALLYAEVLQR